MSHAIPLPIEPSLSADKSSVSRLKLGISLAYYGLVLAIAAIIAPIAAPMIAGSDMLLMVKIVRGFSYVIAGALILVLTGKCLCFAGSRSASDRVLLGLAIASGLVVTITTVAALFTDLSLPLAITGAVLNPVSSGLFVLFLRSLAGSLGDKKLKSRAGFVLVLGAIYSLADNLPLLVQFNPGPLVFVVFGIGLVVLFGYARLLTGLIKKLSV